MIWLGVIFDSLIEVVESAFELAIVFSEGAHRIQINYLLILVVNEIVTSEIVLQLRQFVVALLVWILWAFDLRFLKFGVPHLYPFSRNLKLDDLVLLISKPAPIPFGFLLVSSQKLAVLVANYLYKCFLFEANSIRR